MKKVVNIDWENGQTCCLICGCDVARGAVGMMGKCPRCDVKLHWMLPEDYKKLESGKKLDGIYYEMRDVDGWLKTAFEDMSDEEMDMIFEGKSDEWLKTMCKILGHALYHVGDLYDEERLQLRFDD